MPGSAHALLPGYITRVAGRYIVEDMDAPVAKRIAFESDDLNEAIRFAEAENTLGGAPRKLRVIDRLKGGAQMWPPPTPGP